MCKAKCCLSGRGGSLCHNIRTGQKECLLEAARKLQVLSSWGGVVANKSTTPLLAGRDKAPLGPN